MRPSCLSFPKLRTPPATRSTASPSAPSTRYRRCADRAYRVDHRASGARILHVHCDDPENLFSINFPTPPPDDTGLPHILEHVVLAGSRRFPVREPFFEMLKMSMATFINTMTAPDCTYYPVASNYAARGMSEDGYLHDLMGGLPQLDQCEAVAGAFDDHADALIGRIESIRDFLLNRDRLAVSFTGSDAAFGLASTALASWIASMPSAPVVAAPTGFEPQPPALAGLAEPI